MGEMKPIQGVGKCWKRYLHAVLNEELLLNFIQVNCVFLMQ